MYKFLTLKKEEEILILHMMLGASNRIYWALTTPQNKEIVEDFGLKELEGKWMSLNASMRIKNKSNVSSMRFVN